MGTNGFQGAGHGDSSPAKPGSSEPQRIIGTKRLFADGKFKSKDGKATFLEAPWRGLQAAGKQEEKNKFTFLINNGRANAIWQSAYLDRQDEVCRRPLALSVHPDAPG